MLSDRDKEVALVDYYVKNLNTLVLNVVDAVLVLFLAFMCFKVGRKVHTVVALSSIITWIPVRRIILSRQNTSSAT